MNEKQKAPELLPCPFCGGRAERYTITEQDEVANIGGDVVCCTRCQTSSRVIFGDKEGLTDAWNTRADFARPASEIEAENARLRRFCEFFCDELPKHLKESPGRPSIRIGGIVYQGAVVDWAHEFLAKLEEEARAALAEGAPMTDNHTGIDTSAEAVERLAAHYDERVTAFDGLADTMEGRVRNGRGKETRDFHAETAATLRALSAELAAQSDGVTRLKAALEPFASETNWLQGGPLDPNSPSFAGIGLARAALTAAREAVAWRTVDSAPHETLLILGWYEDGVWKQEIGLASAGQRNPLGYSNRWFHGSATHWLPLPPAPTGHDNSGGA